MNADGLRWEAEEGRDPDGLFGAEWRAMGKLAVAAGKPGNRQEMIKVSGELDRGVPLNRAYVWAYSLVAVRYLLLERFGRMPLRAEIAVVAIERYPRWSLRIVGRREEFEDILLAAAAYIKPPRARRVTVMFMQTIYTVTALSDGDVIATLQRLRPGIAEYCREDPWLLDE